MQLVTLHWSMNEERSYLMRICFNRMVEQGHHLIIGWNHGRAPQVDDDYRFLRTLEDDGHATIVDMGENRAFEARNSCFDRCTDEVVCMIDNDVYLHLPIDPLETFVRSHDKLFTTGIASPSVGRSEREPVDGWRVNDRIGSNFMVGKLAWFRDVGPFIDHVKSGSKWQDKLVHKGYSVALSPLVLAEDMGLRKGFDFTIPYER